MVVVVVVVVGVVVVVVVVVRKAAANEEFDLTCDLYQLVLHLHFEHGFVQQEDFDCIIIFGLL